MGKKESEDQGKRLKDMSEEELKRHLSDMGWERPFSKMQEQLKTNFDKIKPNSTFSTLSNLQDFEPHYDQTPKREIKLSDAKEKRVKEALDYFETNSLYETELLKLFEDWQSDRTKSIKKFLLSLISVLSLTVFAGINILEVRLFNITVADGYQYLFLCAFICVIAGLFYYYEINLWRDKKVNDSNLKVFMESLQRSDQYLEEIDEILEKKGITIEQLINDFDDSSSLLQKKSSPLRGYRLMKFYKNDLEEPHTTDLKIYRFEITGLYFLGLLSVLTIIRSMIWVSYPDADLIIFYLVCAGVIGSIMVLLQLRFNQESYLL